MKIERISDNQIRCTLTREDLLTRHLRISELAYGSDKAKALFHDMMQQASYECDFEADNIPLMIEAIPISADCLVLVVTKVVDPDELDTRFSSFTSSPDEDAVDNGEPEEHAYADEILSCFEQIGKLLGEHLTAKALGKVQKNSGEASDKSDSKPASVVTSLSKIYSFKSLREVSELARIIKRFYKGENTLYKNPDTSVYYLVVCISDHTAEQFNKVCNIISEYGRTEKLSYMAMTYFEEHYDLIIRDNAIQVLAKL